MYQTGSRSLLAPLPISIQDSQSDNHTWHIALNGIVQGVGFRPYVYRLAHELGLKGQVSNGADGLHVYFNASKQLATRFYQKMISNAPAMADIRQDTLEPVDLIGFDDFSIAKSDSSAPSEVLITPDFGICKDCLRELFNAEDRRYRYPFITCTCCGPRYSIMTGLPYDRHQTTMAAFEMCDSCQKEYDDPGGRRYYSQTNSCKTCGVQMDWYAANGQQISCEQSEIPERAAQSLKAGEIVAVKGIGGYLLLCDATNQRAIQTLRARKKRPSKPLAVLCANLEMADSLALLTEPERKELEASYGPIVLSEIRPDSKGQIDLNGIAPGLGHVGLMLPYAPLLALISSDFGKPLIATSGNVSGSPIIHRDEEALSAFWGIADKILTHNRDIRMPQDDSVVRFTKVSGKRIIIRRSRGLAPVLKKNYGQMPQLAVGAQMKGTFAMQTTVNTFLSQYLGDLDHYDTQQNFKNSLGFFENLFKNNPDRVVSDLHPHFFTTQQAVSKARELEVEHVPMQHHLAHFRAVLAENELSDSVEKILGVIWDGTGLGEDGNIWGSEFFLSEGMKRVGSLKPFPHILGDKMSLEPRISALCLSNGNEVLKTKFTQTEWRIWNKLKNQANLWSTSMGRLFDAVACLCELKDVQSFEGEAAMWLEAAATRFFDEQSYAFELSYEVSIIGIGQLHTGDLVDQIINDKLQGTGPDEMAAKFHNTLVLFIEQIAERESVKSMAFSGGVFQNALLTDLIEIRLSQKYNLYFHQELSPGDENVSFGQLFA